MAQTAIVFPPAPSLARKFIERLRNGDEVAHLITFIFAATYFC
jgi:hypothetical protein